jgi:hypothetical protein
MGLISLQAYKLGTFSFSFRFWGEGDSTEFELGLVLAGQALCHLSQAPSSFLKSINI